MPSRFASISGFRLLKYVVAIPVAAWIWFLGRRALSYTSFDPMEGFLIAKQHLVDDPWYLVPFYVHAFSSVFVLILGAVQFSTTMMRRAPRWHRRTGTAYLLVVLGLSGPSGLIISVNANAGLPASVAFFMQATLWILFTAWAWYLGRKGRFEEHGKFLLRSYALALAAVSLRIYAKILPAWFGTFPIETYLTNAWLSWVGNLLIAECLIYLGFVKHFLASIHFSDHSPS